MEIKRIIVIGGSAGSFEVIRSIVRDLPADFDAAIFIVWHMAADTYGILPEVLNREKTLVAANAIDREPILPGRIYVAQPDRHLVIESGIVRVTRGPKENRFRPAIDPLFRSAAFAYGPAVIGVVLSGGLDDGTAGLWTIKNRGGIAIVQDPGEAEVVSMPANAIRQVDVDYIAPSSGIAGILKNLRMNEIPKPKNGPMEEESDANKEIKVMLLEERTDNKPMQFGELTPFACPECHGVLSAIKEGQRVRYRCHTGHAFSANSLLETLTENIERSLWNAVRGMEENVIFLNHVGDHFAETNQPHLAAMYFQKTNEIVAQIKVLRRTLMQNEQLSLDKIESEVRHGGCDEA